ncbi:hypothetical protein CDD80_3082 [Ophiocordyceps camponoti-rufipedis]|uniref:Uncharacterized protein n=1 Tax=Ophiocordyceps camponoti-rufipedis TaxID=2004952 RepID=A0A2C5Z5J3_9HYPO|nr:hypothetical protein CDD80_3082 [Ophiocordyceps camponoti-rufipedis]
MNSHFVDATAAIGMDRDGNLDGPAGTDASTLVDALPKRCRAGARGLGWLQGKRKSKKKKKKLEACVDAWFVASLITGAHWRTVSTVPASPRLHFKVIPPARLCLIIRPHVRDLRSIIIIITTIIHIIHDPSSANSTATTRSSPPPPLYWQGRTLAAGWQGEADTPLTTHTLTHAYTPPSPRVNPSEVPSVVSTTPSPTFGSSLDNLDLALKRQMTRCGTAKGSLLADTRAETSRPVDPDGVRLRPSVEQTMLLADVGGSLASSRPWLGYRPLERASTMRRRCLAGPPLLSLVIRPVSLSRQERFVSLEPYR